MGVLIREQYGRTGDGNSIRLILCLKLSNSIKPSTLEALFAPVFNKRWGVKRYRKELDTNAENNCG